MHHKRKLLRLLNEEIREEEAKPRTRHTRANLHALFIAKAEVKRANR